jgi:DNA-binding response OmpR family regulator
VVISSKDYAQDRVAAKELGVVEFLAKPMSTKAIEELIVRYTTTQ